MLRVITGLYPLAEAAHLIGGPKASVTDPVPPGTDPLTYRPPPGTFAPFVHDGLVLEIGGGFQPSFEAAAAASQTVVAVASNVGSPDPYVWLDPPVMDRAVHRISDAMQAADPKAAPLFRENTASLIAEIDSTGIDYTSTLSVCRRTTFVTAGSAFAAMASQYGLADSPAGPSPTRATASSLAARIRSLGLPSVIAESWIDPAGAARVASEAGVGLRRIDTLAGPPTGGWPRGATYFSLMESNLSVLSSVLACAVEQQ